MDNNKYIFILAGAAGAGKSTLANKLKNNAPKYISPIDGICEADDYWYLIGDGKYAFDMKLLHSAHCWCQNKADNLMRNGENLIVSKPSCQSRVNPFHGGFEKNRSQTAGNPHEKREHEHHVVFRQFPQKVPQW